MVFLGAGGQARAVLGIAEDNNAVGRNEAHVVAVADDNWQRRDRFEGLGIDLVDGLENAADYGLPFLVPIGMPKPCQQVVERALAAGMVAAPPLVHHTVMHRNNRQIGNGRIHMQNSASTTFTQLGEHCALGLNVIVGHDTKVGDFCSLLSGANIAGNCTFGNGVLVGIGAIILPNLTIGDGAVIGAGSVVTRDVAPGEVVAGNPARTRT